MWDQIDWWVVVAIAITIVCGVYAVWGISELLS